MVEQLHVDRLVFVGYYEPKEDGLGNQERCEAAFTQKSANYTACSRAWDIHEAGPPDDGFSWAQ
jgi:hypothetical protein